MPSSPKELLKAVLANPTDKELIASLVTPDATYVSLNFDDPELKRVMPWAGTSNAREGIVQTFIDVARYWDERNLEEIAFFGDERYAALFGRMTYRSTVMKKKVVSPFCVYIEAQAGMIRHMQFMEDTFATTNSFRSGGEWVIQSNPDGKTIRV